MKTFFVILFFGKTLLLTGQPVTVGNGHLLVPLDEPISAVTNGAVLFVDITNMFPYLENGKISEIREEVGDKLKGETISATLKGDETNNNLTYNGGISIGKGKILISLVSDENIMGKSWDEIEIKSSIDLVNVSLLWKNYKE